ncbi:hypothetical protein D1872_303160 [compost metagenome]
MPVTIAGSEQDDIQPILLLNKQVAPIILVLLKDKLDFIIIEADKLIPELPGKPFLEPLHFLNRPCIGKAAKPRIDGETKNGPRLQRRDILPGSDGHFPTHRLLLGQS